MKRLTVWDRMISKGSATYLKAENKLAAFVEALRHKDNSIMRRILDSSCSRNDTNRHLVSLGGGKIHFTKYSAQIFLCQIDGP